MEGVRSHPSSILTSLTKCHQCILTLHHEKVAGVVFSSGYRPQESNSCAQMPVSAVFLVVPGSSAQPPPAPPKGCRWPSCPKPHLQVPWGHLDCLRCPKPSPEVLTVLVRKEGTAQELAVPLQQQDHLHEPTKHLPNRKRETLRCELAF